MKRINGPLGVRMLHARPRNPQGKRFNHTPDVVLGEISLHLSDTLDDLNTKFNAWLCVCYHSVTHSALGTTPEIACKSDSIANQKEF